MKAIEPRHDSEKLIQQNINVTLSDNHNEILSLNFTGLYKHTVDGQEREKTNTTFSAKSVPLTEINTADPAALYEVNETGTCNSIADFSYSSIHDWPDVWYITHTITGYECNEFSYIRVVFK